MLVMLEASCMLFFFTFYQAKSLSNSHLGHMCFYFFQKPPWPVANPKSMHPLVNDHIAIAGMTSPCLIMGTPRPPPPEIRPY